MKKNSFKRFLAVTLAAATALTFAPVSTLGLTSVIEAQAAAITVTNGYTATTTVATTGDDYNVYVPIGQAETAYTLTGLTSKALTKKTGDNGSASIKEATSAADGRINITPDTKESVTTYIFDTSKKVNIITFDLSKIVKEKDKNISLAIGESKELVTAYKFADNVDATYDITAAAGITANNDTRKIYAGGTSTAVGDTDVDIKAGSATVGKIRYSTETVANSIKLADGTTDVTNKSVTFTSRDASAAWDPADKTITVTASGTTATLKAVSADTSKVTAALTAGTGALKLTPDNAYKGKKASTKVFVYPSQRYADADAADGTVDGAANGTSVGAVSLTVNLDVLTKSTITTAPVVNNDKPSTFTWTLKTAKATSGENLSVKYLDKDENPADTYFVDNYTEPDDSTLTGTFTVKTDSAPVGTYKVQLIRTTTGAAGNTTTAVEAENTFEVKAADNNNGNNGNNNAGVITNENSDVFGGVTTSLLATDNTDYNLINSGANFSLNGKTYTANQLSWYLTKEVNATPANMGFTSGAGSITASGTGTLKVHVANAKTFAGEIGGAHIVGIYQGGSYNTIVYNSAISVNVEKAGVVTKHPGTVSISTNLNDVNKQPLSDGSFNGLQFQGVNNKFLSGKESSLGTILSSGRNFNADIKDNGDADKQAVHGSTIASNNTVSSNGVYYETYYVEYFDNSSTGNGAKFVAEIPVVISVNAGPTVEAKENKDSEHAFSSTNSNPVNKDDLYITLDLVNKKTFNLGEHLFSNRDNTTYTYSSDTDNVTIANGVVTAKQEGTAVVTVTPKANGVEGSKIYVFFRVNKQPDDTITVADKNGNQARVLTTREYEGNKSTLTDEEALAAAQVKYIQIDVTGKEGTDKKATLDTKGASDLTFALADPTTTLTDRVSVDSKTGEITIAHAYLNSASFKPFAFAVKVVSTATAKTALTTGYFYIVVDYADAQVTGLEASYEVGTSYTEPYDNGSYLNLSPFEVYGPVHVSSTTNNYSVRQLYRSDDLENEDLYTDDDFGAFDTSNGNYAIRRATVAGKTAHVLIAAGDPDKKIGTTYKVVELKSVAGQSNYVTKIVDADNNTIYDAATSAVSGAAITIDKTTVVTVTVAHKPDASLNAKADPAFTIDDGGDPFNYNPDHLFVAATEDPYTYQITLIPSQKGTQIVAIVPTEGRLSKTDYSLVGAEKFNLTVKNNGEAATTGKPGKVTGIKVSNKKGAKVTVKFDKINSYPTMRYYVQKKIGKKTSGKSVGSTKTTLSVAKGKTVKVRVKAYYYDANGTKHVGAYSSWKTLKTDKK